MTANPSAKSGLDLAALNSTIRPQDDLYLHVNGSWIDNHEIPADRPQDGAFHALRDLSEERVREIIEEAGAAVLAGGASGVQAKIGALYQSFMDEAQVEATGIGPLEEDLALIQAANTRADLLHVVGQLQRTGVTGVISFGAEPDPADPHRYLMMVGQSGLGLPDEAYYREDQHAEVREAYVAHVARMLQLAGVASGPDADAAAARVMKLETTLAADHWDVVRSRDMDKILNPMTLGELQDSAPGFDLTAWVAALQAPQLAFEELIVMQPSWFVALGQHWQNLELEDWKLWLAWHVISSRAPYLPSDFVQANFDFYGRTLSGTPQLRERWKRGVGLVEGCLGEAVGEVYVAKHFPQGHKAKMDELVANLIEAYRQSIRELDWMGPQTRERALQKLDGFNPKVGYPPKWRDYTDLEISATDLLGNVRRATAFELDFEFAKIGKPVDRDEWLMTPQTVNAYYHPMLNEIVFPAAILQPPFFDPEAEDAVNYGGIGAVIGHEIGHGFDDQGSKFGPSGVFEDWWTEEDRAEFERRTKALIAQYDAFSPAQLGDEHHVNGAFTIGENIGDLGGLSIALRAYALSLGGDLADAPVIDGYTGVQRVFLGWAQVWRSKSRDELMVMRLATDPHSPSEFRCNGVVSNVPEFYQAFDVQPDDALYLPEAQRVRIW